MAKKLDPLLVEILTRHGERVEDAVWDCHGTWVVYHKAIERIAAKAGVVFDLPQIIEANTAAKTVAIAVAGHMGDRSEWSFGEAAPLNNKNAYPYAMAEKRAKDRVVLKLVGLHGLAYSEEEFDTREIEAAKREDAFRQSEPPATPPLRDGLKTNKQTGRTSANSLKQDKSPDNWDAFLQEIAEAQSVQDLLKRQMAWSAIKERDVWPTSWVNLAKSIINDRREELLRTPAPDDDVFPPDRPNAYLENMRAG